MTVCQATATLAKIDAFLEKDQGEKYRALLRETIADAEDAYRPNGKDFRVHLGASIAGRDCPRYVWYSFRWFQKQVSTARMLRLFNRGHLEEARFVALLRMIDCEVWQHDQNGDQFRVSLFGGHFGGSLDGVVRGLPECPSSTVLTEFKTHSKKSFTNLQKVGVLAAKPEHFAQMQLYMHGYQLPTALYLAVNKDDDTLYGEFVGFDKEYTEHLIDRVGSIIQLGLPPKKISDTASWYQCKYCEFSNVCHVGKTPAVNCRTCKWSAPTEDGNWLCTRGSPSPVLSTSQQLYGCSGYTIL